METRLFEIQAEHLRDNRQNRRPLPDSRAVIHAVLRPAVSASAHTTSHNGVSNTESVRDVGMKADASAVEFARCFLRLANLPNFALDRLSSYEATLWRQVGRILFALDALDRRKPQERTRSFSLGSL